MRLAQCEGPEVTGWHDTALPVEGEPPRPRAISALSQAGWGPAVGKTGCSGTGTNCPFNRIPTEQASSTSIQPQQETSVLQVTARRRTVRLVPRADHGGYTSEQEAS